MKTTKQPRDWKCNECGKRMTLTRAEKASTDDKGCPGCGGADIEWSPGAKTAEVRS